MKSGANIYAKNKLSNFSEKKFQLNVFYMKKDPLEYFESICDEMCDAFDGVYKGPMMSSPGLKFNNKVFAFYHKNTMGFRLGPQFDPVAFGLVNPQPLSPFKTKPPLKGWYIIDEVESNTWKELAELALDFTKTLK